MGEGWDGEGACWVRNHAVEAGWQWHWGPRSHLRIRSDVPNLHTPRGVNQSEHAEVGGAPAFHGGGGSQCLSPGQSHVLAQPSRRAARYMSTAHHQDNMLHPFNSPSPCPSSPSSPPPPPPPPACGALAYTYTTERLPAPAPLPTCPWVHSPTGTHTIARPGRCRCPRSGT